jgi:hypothetical protein
MMLTLLDKSKIPEAIDDVYFIGKHTSTPSKGGWE